MNYLIALVISVAAGMVSGWSLTSTHYLAEISRIEADQDKAVVAAYQAQAERTQRAKDRGDALETRLARAEYDRQIQTEENAREIRRLTIGRPCLGGNVVRLLNQPRPGSEPSPVPEATREPLAADAAVATDTDIASWINGARNQYETCRDRLQALIDWHQEETP